VGGSMVTPVAAHCEGNVMGLCPFGWLIKNGGKTIISIELRRKNKWGGTIINQERLK